MDAHDYSTPINLKDIRITDEFWHREQELVRMQVIPYQWEALNDRVEGAAPSFCMHNFRAAGRLLQKKREQGVSFKAPAYTFRGFETLPQDGVADPDQFYGFVFQDTDFYKWIEAVAYSLCNHPDPELEKTADEAIDIVCAAQQENGYLDTYYIVNGMDRAFTNLKDHHELYCLGHLAEGAAAYFQATGKEKLLKAACRYADYCVEFFGPEEGQCKGYPGHEIAEMALARLYEVTGERRYLELSSFFLNQRGSQPYYFDEEGRKRAELEEKPWKGDENPDRYAYYQAHLPVREQSEAVGHAVRAVYLYSGMADMARLTGDESLYRACKRLWDSIVSEKLYVTGGIGGTAHGEAFSHPYDLPNDQAYSETCAAIGLAFFARRMLEISADSRYADVMERALYNTVLAGMALDGKSFFYVNPLEVVPGACHKDSRLSHVQPVRQKWFGCACCPPNIARIVSSLGAYVYTLSEETRTLYTHLYVGSELTVPSGGEEMRLTTETDMPWGGHFHVDVTRVEMPDEQNDGQPDSGMGRTGEKDAETYGKPYTLAFRIPGWSGESRIQVRCGGNEYVLMASGGKLIRTGEKPFREMTDMDEKKAASEETLTPWNEENRGRIPAAGEETPDDHFLKTELKNGYLYLSGSWSDGDSVALDFTMEPHMVTASPKVRDDIGKVAFTRGPITYCMEEADNGADLHLNRVDLSRIGSHCRGIIMEEDESLGHKMMLLKVPGLRMKTGCGVNQAAEQRMLHEDDLLMGQKQSLYQDYLTPVEEQVTLNMIPYYAWANRGEGEMQVWVRV
ncbi:MAG: glycoside hydrolase family 127 protein [Lachnospiraceae bacterium]|nr:glycoside hydrolase family 127 protein [Lachnospiraceae bacterium]